VKIGEQVIKHMEKHGMKGIMKFESA